MIVHFEALFNKVIIRKNSIGKFGDKFTVIQKTAFPAIAASVIVPLVHKDLGLNKPRPSLSQGQVDEIFLPHKIVSGRNRTLSISMVQLRTISIL